MPTDEPENDYDFGGRPGVPRGEGRTWGEVAEEARPDAEVDLSCPNGCYELTVTAHHDMGDALEFLRATALQDEPGPCPNCHAEIEPEVLTDG